MRREPAVVLDALRERDRDGLLETYTSPALRRFLGGGSTVEIAIARVNTLLQSLPQSNWAVRDDLDGEFLGLISLTRHHDGVDTEVSYILLPHAQGRGIATVALRAALDHAFSTLRLERIVAETQSANDKSVALLTRLGMRSVKTLVRFDAPQTIFAIDSSTFIRLENERIATTILEHCHARPDGGTICPSEVARALWPRNWRGRMQAIRDVGRRLAREGDIEITQRGVVRAPNEEIRGAIRYRSKRA